jgi:hypothetical protein
MELLIPGLILVALMAWASTKIKKRASDAFESELIETENYAVRKPDGFLHVIGDPDHEFRAYSKEFGGQNNSGDRRATIEIDVFPGRDLESVRDQTTQMGASPEIKSETATACDIEATEAAGESLIDVYYKIVSGRGAVYRLRFAALAEHSDEYLRKRDETFESFFLKTN